MRMGKISWTEIYMACLFLWSLLYCISFESTFGTSLSDSIYIFYRVIWILIQILLVVKILFQKPIKKRTVYLGFIIILIGLLSTYSSRSAFLTPFFWFLASANKVESRKAIKTIFIAQLIALVLVIGLSVSGLIDNISVIRSSGLIRQGMGFTHPNSLAAKILQLCLMYLYLKKDKIKIWNSIALVAIAGITIHVTDSRTSMYLLIFTAILSVLYTMSQGKTPLFRLLSNGVFHSLRYVFISITAVSVIMSIAFTESDLNGFGIDSSSTLFSRFSQMYLYFSHYDIKLFGQPLYYHNNESMTKISTLYTLDNAYMYLLLGFGIFIFIVFIYLYIQTVRRSIRSNDYMQLIILSVYAIYGLSETMMIRFSFNFSLIFLFSILWDKRNSQYN